MGVKSGAVGVDGRRSTGTVTGPEGDGFGQPRGDAQNAGTCAFVTGCAKLSKVTPNWLRISDLTHAASRHAFSEIGLTMVD